MNENRNWYALYTRSRREKRVTDILTRRKIESYCPINKVVRHWSDRKKIVNEPLFNSYVFVKISENELFTIKQIDGVINLVYWLGKPAIIRDAEIDIIKKFLNNYVGVRLEKTSISVNNQVRIVNGPLMELEGKVVALKSKTIKIMLPSLGYMMQAEVNLENVRLITPRILDEQEFPITQIAINE